MKHSLGNFLEENNYIDFRSSIIQEKAKTLFEKCVTDKERANTAFEFVRDQIPHSFDCNASLITACASDVLKYKTGICFAKSNLLAALLRSQGIPTGFCYQHLTLLDDDSKGYCLHCYNAVFINGNWIKLDARGNKRGIDAQFSLGEPILAFLNRGQYDEYFFDGIYDLPDMPTMKMLEQATNIKDVADGLSQKPFGSPEILE